MLKIGLDDDECAALYRDIDTNNNNSVSYQEFVEKFSKVNTMQLIKNVNTIVRSSGNSAESLFN